MKLRVVESLDEMIPTFEAASATDHPNAYNYRVDAFRMRWKHYELFTVLEDGSGVLSFCGVASYGHINRGGTKIKLVRVADRLFTFDRNRKKTLSMHHVTIRPAVDYFIPYHTKWAFEQGYEAFFSVQEQRKRASMERVVNMLDPALGYRMLPDLYCTTPNPEHELSWQNVAATTSKIHLPSRRLHIPQKESG